MKNYKLEPAGSHVAVFCKV